MDAARLVRTVTQRVDSGAARGARRAVPPLAVHRRRLYILPTPFGWFFALLLLVMLLGATHYANSLAFALTFWLAAIALVSMHRAHRNLVSLRLAGVVAEPAFAGHSARFEITLENRAGRARQALAVAWTSRAGAAETIDVAAGARTQVELAIPAEHRGRLACPPITIESRFPMGLFRVWTQLHPRAGTLVYPARRGERPLAALTRAADQDSDQRPNAAGEFLAHRDFVPGDPPRAIDWKTSARRDQLLVREHTEQQSPDLDLVYEHLHGLPAEARLCQLALWVDDAERAGRRYRLTLPDRSLGPASGAAHRRNCLIALALW